MLFLTLSHDLLYLLSLFFILFSSLVFFPFALSLLLFLLTASLLFCLFPLLVTFLSFTFSPFLSSLLSFSLLYFLLFGLFLLFCTFPYALSALLYFILLLFPCSLSPTSALTLPIFFRFSLLPSSDFSVLPHSLTSFVSYSSYSSLILFALLILCYLRLSLYPLLHCPCFLIVVLIFLALLSSSYSLSLVVSS